MARPTPTETADALHPDEVSVLGGLGKRLGQWADDLPFVPLRPYEHRGLQIGWRAAVMLVLIGVAFAFGVSTNWQWQDERLYADPAVRNGRALAAAWADPLHGETAPMTRTLAWAQTRLLGLGPAGFRVVGLLLHATTCLFGWFVMRRLGVPAAWLAATAVAVHPALAAHVAWPLRQGDLLASAASAAAAWAYLVARRVQPAFGERVWTDPAYHGDDDYNPRWPWAVFGLGMAVALLCGSAVPILAVGGLVALEAQFRQLTRTGTLALGGLLVLAVVARVALPHAALPAQDLRPMPAASRFAEAVAAVPLATLNAVLPVGQPLAQDRGPWAGAATLAVYGGLTVALVAVAGLRRRPWRWFAVAAAAYAIVHGLTAGWPRSPAVAGADLLPYGMVAVVVVGVVAAVAAAVGRRTDAAANRAVRWAGGALVLATLGATTAFDGPAYALPDTAWQRALAANPDDQVAREELAARYVAEGFLDEAGYQLDRVVGPRRDVAWLLARGRLFDAQKRHAEAAQCYETAHAQRPDDNATTTMYAEAMNTIGRPDVAAGLYARLVERSPQNVDVLTNAGLTQMRVGKPAEAIALYEKALALDADHIPAHVNVANALFEIERYEEAAKHLQRVVALDPRNYVAFINAGVMLYRLGDFANAERMFRGAVFLQQSADAYRKLGTALAVQNKIAEAVWSYGQAANLDPYDAATNAELARLRRPTPATLPRGE